MLKKCAPPSRPNTKRYSGGSCAAGALSASVGAAQTAAGNANTPNRTALENRLRRGRTLMVTTRYEGWGQRRQDVHQRRSLAARIMDPAPDTNRSEKKPDLPRRAIRSWQNARAGKAPPPPRPPERPEAGRVSVAK